MTLPNLLVLAAHNWPLLLLQIAGVWLACRVSPRPVLHVLALGSLWLGGSLWHLLLYGLASLQVGTHVAYLAAIMLGVVTLAIGRTAILRQGWRTCTHALALTIVTWLAALLITARWGSGFTYDSLQLVIQGLNWIEFGHLGSAVAQSKLLSWGGWVSTLHAASHFSGTQYLSAAHPVLALQLVLMLAAALWQSCTPAHRTLGWAAMSLVLALIASSTYLSYVGIYVHNNLATGGFFFLAAYLSVQLIQDRDSLPLGLVLAAWCMFALQRTETIPLACLGVWLTYTYAQLPPTAWRRIGLWFTLPLSLWILQRLSAPMPQKSILGHASLTVYLLGVWLHPWVVRGFIQTPRRKAKAPAVALGLGVTVLLVLLLLRLPHMNISLQSMATNLAPDSPWGPAWIVMGLLAFATLGRSRSTAGNFLGTTIGLFLIYVLALSALRIAPYRVGFGDSGSRMLLHVAPLVILYLTLRLQQPADALPAGMRRVAYAALALAAVVGLDLHALWRAQTHNVLAQATITADHVPSYQIQALVLDQGSATFDITEPSLTFSWHRPRTIDKIYLEIAHPGSVSDVTWYADGVSLPLGSTAHLTQLKLRNLRFDRGWYALSLDQPVRELRLQFVRQSIPVTIRDLGIYDRHAYWQDIPRDYAERATSFSRSSLRGNGIDLQPVLAGQRPDVRSRKPGPVDAFVALPATIRGGHIEIDFYRPEEIPDHYSVSVSPDGRNWHNVYTCTPEACPPAAARVPATRQYLFDPERSYKYVRVAMQHAPGSGRLWLRKIRIFGYE